MSLKLYGIGASRASRPLWMLEELGVSYEHIQTDYRHRATRTEDFLKLNPNGHIPVLVDGDIIVWESMATTLYLARRFETVLSPQSLAEEAEVLRWTFWVVTECEKDALQVLFHRVVMREDRADKALADQAEKRLLKPLGVIEAHLCDRQWLAAERFTVADLYVASVLSWARPMACLSDQLPHTANWLGQCLARPSQQRVRQLARETKTS